MVRERKVTDLKSLFFRLTQKYKKSTSLNDLYIFRYFQIGKSIEFSNKKY